jgi:hypothetical protein
MCLWFNWLNQSHFKLDLNIKKWKKVEEKEIERIHSWGKEFIYKGQDYILI